MWRKWPPGISILNQCKTINKQQNLKLFFYWIIYETTAVKYHIQSEVCNREERLWTTKAGISVCLIDAYVHEK